MKTLLIILFSIIVLMVAFGLYVWYNLEILGEKIREAIDRFFKEYRK
jgi:uncharacterized protein YxeA